MYVRITVLCRIEWLNFFRKTNYLDLFSKGCKYLNLRDACMSGSLNLKDLPNQSVDTKAMAKKPCRPLVFCGPPGVDISSIIKGLKRRLPDTFSLVVSHTSREPQKEMRCSTFHNDLKCEVEIDGVDYHFTDRITMTTAIEKGNNYYILKEYQV